MPTTTGTENLSAQVEWTVIAVTNTKHCNSLPPLRMRATAAAARSNQIAGVGNHHQPSPTSNHAAARTTYRHAFEPQEFARTREKNEIPRRSRGGTSGVGGERGTDIVERPLLLVVDLRVPEGLELLHRRRRHLPSRIAFLEG